MITRRLVRIKTLQALYAWQQADNQLVEKGKISLRNNLLVLWEVYLFLLEFPWHLNHYLESERDIEKSKFYPNSDRIRKYGLLSKSELVQHLFEKATSRKRKLFLIDWSAQAEQFNALYEQLLEQDFVQDYLVFDHPNADQQAEFLSNLFEFLINGSEPFNQIIEEMYHGWNDDDNLILREIQRTLDSKLRIAEQDDAQSEDVVFGVRLFQLVAENGKDYETKVESITENWDPGRIAVLDLIAIKMALAEFLSFPEIPLKVTINEYIDIIRDYSTPSSARFINGILDKLRIRLQDSGAIKKSGRGLRDR